MRALFRQQGATLNISILADKHAQNFINAHADILNSAFRQTEMSDTMRQRLESSNYIFSGIKTFHELNEAFPTLIDENGNRKTFEHFLNDVQNINNTYNHNYLRAEYNFAHASATMAAKWDKLNPDNERYFLQYRTAGDSHVRKEHARLNRITLPATDPFWDKYYPPNGWNCRCSAVQVRKAKYPATPHNEAMTRGEEAVPNDTSGIFRFNSGKQKKTFPDYNPYTIRRCNDCDVTKGKATLVFVPENELCAACKLVRQCFSDKKKSVTAKLRMHYKKEMAHLKSKAVPITLNNGKKVKVKFDKRCIEHLYSDTFKRCKADPDDLKNIDKVIANATCIADTAHIPGHNNPYEHFFYFEAQMGGNKIYINIGRLCRKQKNGKLKKLFYCYSINDVIKET